MVASNLFFFTSFFFVFNFSVSAAAERNDVECTVDENCDDIPEQTPSAHIYLWWTVDCVICFNSGHWPVNSVYLYATIAQHTSNDDGKRCQWHETKKKKMRNESVDQNKNAYDSRGADCVGGTYCSKSEITSTLINVVRDVAQPVSADVCVCDSDDVRVWLRQTGNRMYVRRPLHYPHPPTTIVATGRIQSSPLNI